jgi:hypothetical protein
MDHIEPTARSAIDAAAMLGALPALIQAIPPEPARRTPAGTEARLRFTAPFDMRHPRSRYQAAEGLPVGFQIVGRIWKSVAAARSTCGSAGDGTAQEPAECGRVKFVHVRQPG